MFSTKRIGMNHSLANHSKSVPSRSQPMPTWASTDIRSRASMPPTPAASARPRPWQMARKVSTGEGRNLVIALAMPGAQD